MHPEALKDDLPQEAPPKSPGKSCSATRPSWWRHCDGTSQSKTPPGPNPPPFRTGAEVRWTLGTRSQHLRGVDSHPSWDSDAQGWSDGNSPWRKFAGTVESGFPSMKPWKQRFWAKWGLCLANLWCFSRRAVSTGPNLLPAKASRSATVSPLPSPLPFLPAVLARTCTKAQSARNIQKRKKNTTL